MGVVLQSLKCWKFAFFIELQQEEHLAEHCRI